MQKRKILQNIMAIMMCMLMIYSNVYADTLEVNCRIQEESNEHPYDFYGTPLRTDRALNIENIWWTGREYITLGEKYGEYKKSVDLVNWETVYINRYLWEDGKNYTYMWNPVIEYYDGIYIIRDLIYENVNEIVAQLSRGDTLRNSSILVFDENFELLKQVDFEHQLTAFSYVNGRFYARLQDYETNFRGSYQPINTIYVSDDGINWTVDETLTEVPLSNQRNVLNFGDGVFYGESYDNESKYIMNDVFVTNTQGETAQINYEQVPYRVYDEANGIYISYEESLELGVIETSFKVSLDGIYWHEICFPIFEKYEQIVTYRQMGNKLLFLTNDRLLEYDIEELKQSIIAKNGLDCTYVKMNREILGFDTMPIMEEDRMLVPMRFLFEQMGAEVEWDGTTNTASAVLSPGTEGQIQTFGLEYAKTVTFSIDNTTAKVNGAEVTMDVPARLINDKTMVPLRFLSENLGYTVTWDDENKTAIIE